MTRNIIKIMMTMTLITILSIGFFIVPSMAVNFPPKQGQIDRMSYQENMYLYVSGIDELYGISSGDYTGFYFNLPIYIEVRDSNMKYINSDISVSLTGYYECYGGCRSDYLYYRIETDVNSLKIGISVPYNNMKKYQYLGIIVEAKKHGSTATTHYWKYPAIMKDN